MVIEKISLDLSLKTHPVTIKAKQGDRESRFIEASLYSNNVAYNIPNTAIVLISYLKPDRKKVENTVAKENIIDNKITFPLTEQMLTVAGTGKCDVKIADNNGIVSTATFKVLIDAQAVPDFAVESLDEYNSLIDALIEFRARYIQAESHRDDLYSIAESDRETSYSTAEGIRNSDYTNSENSRNTQYTQEKNSRNTQYTQEENKRNIQYQDAEDQRDSLYDTVEETRNTSYNTAENLRNSDYVDAENERKGLYQNSEDERDSLYGIAEAARDELYDIAEGLRDADYTNRANELETTYAPRLTNVETDLAGNTNDIVKNTSDIAKNTEDIAKNKLDISRNTNSISDNEASIMSLSSMFDNVTLTPLTRRVDKVSTLGGGYFQFGDIVIVQFRFTALVDASDVDLQIATGLPVPKNDVASLSCSAVPSGTDMRVSTGGSVNVSGLVNGRAYAATGVYIAETQLIN